MMEKEVEGERGRGSEEVQRDGPGDRPGAGFMLCSPETVTSPWGIGVGQ